MKTPSETLRKAAEIMSERGHCKWTLENGAGEVCANGALILALREEDDARATMGHIFGEEYQAFITAADKLARSLDPGWSRFKVAEWNDRKDTTGEDVILAMKRAASSEDE